MADYSINPYNFDFSDVVRVASCSHQHCELQSEFNNIVHNGGYRHYAISNYYPSAPVYPLSSKFTNVPSDAISCPNAEHHNTNITGQHINGLGCTLVSGSPEGQFPVGMGGIKWQDAFKKILDTLLYSDGGGITINHPTWSNNHGSGYTTEKIAKLLDYDVNKVLGIEIYNSNSNPPEYNLELWDSILLTGRRCWGFGASDHVGQSSGPPDGKNVLLVDDATEHKCLQAYRNGNFYVQIHNTELTFDNISFVDGQLDVSSTLAISMNVVIDGISTSYNANHVSIEVPPSSIYVRVEAFSSDDAIYSQPIILNGKYYPKDSGKSFFDMIPFLN